MTSVPESNRDTARNYGRLWGEFTTWVASSVYMNISDKSLAAYLHSQRVEGSSLAHCREILAAVRYRDRAHPLAEHHEDPGALGNRGAQSRRLTAVFINP